MSYYDRKITKIGNSYGVTIPVEVLKEAGLSYGDHVRLELDNHKITIQKKKDMQLPEGLDSDFMDVLNDVIQEHHTAFKGLVDK